MVEIDILTACQHVNVVKLLEAFLHDDKLWVSLNIFFDETCF